ncbi:MAG: aminotransferase class V-fold PLP-dependent enzyme, partial [Acidimicrobiales bacterium]
MDVPSFPTAGRPVDELLAEIRGSRGGDADWRGGRTFSLVYNPADPELERLQEAVAQEYLHENYLNPFAFPSLLRMEQEVVAMASDLLGAPSGAGKLTSGGTESIFLAVQVAREHARTARGIAEPQLVTATTAHPAFAKAAHYLDVEHILVPVGDDGRLDPNAAAAAVGDRAALLVGSAPCYPFGVIDPIPELAALAAERGVLCHVDACLWGWLLPFWSRLGEPVPPWDLSVPGVTSLSA